MGSEGADSSTIPTVDLSPFFEAGNEATGREKAKQIITESCKTHGFFRIVNHRFPAAVMKKAIDFSRDFFGRPDHEKIKSGAVPGCNSFVPTGYMRPLKVTGENHEYLLLLNPELGHNVYPADPPQYRSTLDECFRELSKTAHLVLSILTECMGLPQNFIKKYDRDTDPHVMAALHYFPLVAAGATAEDTNAFARHEDANCISFVFQDDVGGLEFLKDGDWISADPLEGSIVVNIGDLIKVMTNNVFVSATHRVVRKERDRYSYAFFFNAAGDKLIEPLPRFTSEIGSLPRYKGFHYRDYRDLRMNNVYLPREDFVDLSRYAI